MEFTTHRLSQDSENYILSKLVHTHADCWMDAIAEIVERRKLAVIGERTIFNQIDCECDCSGG